MERRLIRRVCADWQDAVLVCRKCSKRVGGGFGPKGKTRLAKALRKYLGGKKNRRAKIGVVETKCLSACPKRAVTVVTASNLLDWKLIEPGAPIEWVVEELGLEPS